MAKISIHEYEKALVSLQESLELIKTTDEKSYSIIRDACIQRFEFCIELSWKTGGKILGSSSTTSRPVIREMAQNGLIKDVNIWFEFIVARNKSSHTYDENIAQAVFNTVKSFLPHGHELLEKLKEHEK